ncbi:beta-N-acetylhexosaminidase [Paracoccus sp. (in: a-proteobacteria)]|uniref:beta-N-acetylhexosaminidase n=1 Tax=Paracoccus sp. TaxID=267 RepID=UPI0026E0B2A0|nr:beta-N-acetylhexosaminidase [Paracoccus sp. (in: a-proteobacteria)]MDO5368929.1 beta-N-acetylhexosaminidase [Paracoccus sp. (in: a-proteobacteria)]
MSPGTRPAPPPTGGARAHGATILGVEGLALGADERAFLRDADPWGFILFARNVDHPDQLRHLTADLRDAVGREAVVMVDQEGGRVQRLRPPHWTEWPPAIESAADGRRAVELRHRLMGQELRAVGIDADAAPCLDIADAATHPFLKNRCFGTDPETVSLLGRAAAEGLLAAGVLPIAKHLPGHGRTRVDSHHDLPVLDVPLDELDATDFAPFRALNDLPMGMTAHIRLTELDDRPATASPAAIRLIRQRIGFRGLLMSDDIGMNALTGTPAERASAAIAAGCDLVLACNLSRAGFAQVAEAAGPMTHQAMARAEAALARRAAPDRTPAAELQAELAAVLAA